MNKYANYKNTSLACVTILCIYIWGCDTSKYNFKNIFVLNKELWARAEKINGENAFVIKIKESEFKHVRQIIVKQGFEKWQVLRGVDIYSGKLRFSERFHDNNKITPVFSINKKAKLDGVFPVLIYYPDKHLLYLIIADALV